MTESSEGPEYKKTSQDRVPAKAKFVLAATAAIATAGAVFGIFKSQGGFEHKGENSVEPAVTRSAEEFKVSLIKKINEAYSGREIEKPEGEKYPDQVGDLRFNQLTPVDYDLFHSAKGVEQMLEACRTDGNPVTYLGKEYRIDQNFRDYRAVVLLNCEAAATSLKWGYIATGDDKFKDALRNMFTLHKNAASTVGLESPKLNKIFIDDSLKRVYRPILGDSFGSEDTKITE